MFEKTFCRRGGAIENKKREIFGFFRFWGLLRLWRLRKRKKSKCKCSNYNYFVNF